MRQARDLVLVAVAVVAQLKLPISRTLRAKTSRINRRKLYQVPQLVAARMREVDAPRDGGSAIPRGAALASSCTWLVVLDVQPRDLCQTIPRQKALRRFKNHTDPAQATGSGVDRSSGLP